jgi:hypothetical protein
MALLSFTLLVLYLALAVGMRTLLQLRSTGSTGLKGISGRPGSAEWAGGVLFVMAFALALAAQVLDLVNVIDPVPWLDGTAGHALGFIHFLAGRALRAGHRAADDSELSWG